MKKLKITRRSALVTGALATASVYLGYSIGQLSAEPSDEKDCTCTPVNETGTCQATNPASQVLQSAGTPSINWHQKGGFINDVSCLNRTPVTGIIKVKSEDDIRDVLSYARANQLKVSIAGVKHSMGGHAFYNNAIVIDIKQFNKISVDASNKLVTVQSGATWHDIQNQLHPKFAIKAMQSSDIFTVGGSIAVNAHGMDHNAGSVGRTIRAMRVMMSDGMIKNVSRTENAELFHLIIGGYGLFGIVLDVVIEITENVIYKTSRRYIDYRDFGAIFEKELKLNPALGLFYGHLSTSPQSLLREMILYLYEQQPILPAESVEIPALSDVSGEKLRRFTLNFAKLGSIPMQIKWFAEKYIEPRMESCLVKPRAQAMTEGEACLVTRNEPMHDSVGYLRNAIPNETDVLHEYFIPRNQFLTFVDGLREIVQKHTVNLLNASVRVVHKEDNMLNYAPQDAFSIVLYINQKTDTDAIDQMKTVTQELIDLCASVEGRFFLPYQLYYTPAQLTRSYPMIHTFFTKKLVYDPIGLFTNTFYEKYSNALGTA